MFEVQLTLASQYRIRDTVSSFASRTLVNGYDGSTLTGTTSKTAIKSFTIPPNTVGKMRAVEFKFMLRKTGANGSTISIEWGESGSQQVLIASPASASTLNWRCEGEICGDNSDSAQSTDITQVTFTTAGSVVTNGALPLTVDQTKTTLLTVYATPANVGDSIALKYARIIFVETPS